MEDISSILDDFIRLFSDEIFNFFNRFYSYLKDMIIVKGINLREKTSQDDSTRRKTLKCILYVIKLTYMTINVSKTRITEDLIQLEKVIDKKGDDYPEYYYYFERDLKGYIDQVLFDILIEYIIDLDILKLNNLDLFDLLPRNFKNHLDEFKKKRITSEQIKNLIKEQVLEIKDSIVIPNFIDDNKKKETKIENSSIIGVDSSEELEKKHLLEKAPLQEIIPFDTFLTTQRLKFSIPKNPKSFLDFIGHFQSINYDITKRFNVNLFNLINTHHIDPEFLNLENLYYYITTLRMLNIPLPISSKKVVYILEKYVNGKIFSSSKDNEPDPINIFYGLAIISEIDQLYTSDIVDFMEIEMFLESELKNFIPEKLHLNFYTILCLKLLKKSGGLITLKTHIFNDILDLDVFSKKKEDDNHLLDIFEHLACIRILDNNFDLSHFNAKYMKTVKRLMTSSGYINDTITDSARALLIMDLLGVKKAEFHIYQHLLNLIITKVKYFNSESVDKKFYWKDDKIAFSLELRMLFWALLSSTNIKLLK